MLKIITEQDPILETDNYDVVLVGVNTFHLFEGTWLTKLQNKYSYLTDVDNRTKPEDRKLGTCLTIKGKPMITFMYISKYPLYFKQYIDYEALKQCLSTINEEFKGKKILTTIVGSTKFDGLGERDKCLEILKEYTNNLEIDVYDYPITSTKYIFKKLRQYFNKVKQKHKINAEKKRIIDQLKKDVIKALYLKDSEKE